MFSHCGLFQKYENDTWVQFGDKNGPCVEFLHFQLMTVHTRFMDFIYVFFQKPPKKVVLVFQENITSLLSSSFAYSPGCTGSWGILAWGEGQLGEVPVGGL